VSILTSSGQPTSGSHLAGRLGEDLPTAHRKNEQVQETPHGASDLYGFFGTNDATEYGREIRNLEC
jgi:hypothetical protein